MTCSPARGSGYTSALYADNVPFDSIGLNCANHSVTVTCTYALCICIYACVCICAHMCPTWQYEVEMCEPSCQVACRYASCVYMYVLWLLCMYVLMHAPCMLAASHSTVYGWACPGTLALNMACTYLSVYACMHVFIHSLFICKINKYLSMHACMYVCMYMRAVDMRCIYLSICACMHAFVCLHIHADTDTYIHTYAILHAYHARTQTWCKIIVMFKSPLFNWSKISKTKVSPWWLSPHLRATHKCVCVCVCVCVCAI
jgi:hypothetical protein